MKRRALCVVLIGALAARLPARAQQRKVRIAFLGGGMGMSDPGVMRNQVMPLRSGLRQLGYVEGQNLEIEFRFAEGKPERIPALLAELIAWAPDVLVTSGPRPAMLAKEATRTIPVVAAAIDDPVLSGLAVSHARPGGNITGLSGALSKASWIGGCNC